MDSVRTIAKDYMVAGSDKEGADKSCKKLDEILLKEQDKRSRKENEWRLVVAFLEGDQWLRVNRQTKRLDRDRDPSEEAPWRVKMVSNQMVGIYQTLLSRMTQNDPIPEAIPATGDPSDVKSAQLAETLIKYLHDHLDMDEKLVEAVGYALIGQGYWEIYWDSNARTPINYIIHPTETDESGDPLLVPAGSPDAESLRTQAEVDGVELQEETVYEGEIGIEVLSPFEVYLLGGRTPNEAHSAIKVKGYTKEYIQDRWGEEAAKELKPDAKADIEIGNGRKDKDEKSDLIIVKQLYVKPTNVLPEGLYKVWSQGKILYQGNFPYEHGQLPFAKFGGVKIPGATYDASLLFQLIPLQKELNKTISQIIEYKNLTLRPQIISPVNALRTRPTSKPGQVIEYEWRPGMPAPGWRELNNIPQYVFTHIDQVLQRINDVSGQHDASHGRNPSNVRSGDMLSLLLERDDSRMGLMIKDMERAMSRAYRQMLQLAQQFYTESRTLEIRGSAGILETKVFESSDLAGARDIRLSPGTMIPKSKAYQADELRMLLDAGHITPQQYMQMSDFGGSAELAAQWEADRRKQQREIDAIKRDEQIALPMEYDDHGAHLDVLDLYLKSIEFESLPEEQQQALMEHRTAHSEAIAQAQDAMTAENIRATIAGQLRGDMTPSVIAAILGRAGVQIDAEQLTEEMLSMKDQENQLRQENMAVESELKIQEKQAEAELDEDKAEADLERQEVSKDADMTRQAMSQPSETEYVEEAEDDEEMEDMEPEAGLELTPEMAEQMSAAELMQSGMAPEEIAAIDQMTPEDLAALQASNPQMMQESMPEAMNADMAMPEAMDNGMAVPEDMNDAMAMPQDQAMSEGMTPMGLDQLASQLTPEEMALLEEELRRNGSA